MTLAQHQSKSCRWQTPPDLLNRCRLVLGEIDLDPASEFEANENVRAERWLGESDDGLAAKWSIGEPVSVFLNPPGGRRSNRSLTCLFWQRLCKEAHYGGVSHAIFVAFSLGALQTTHRYGPWSACEFPHCIAAQRIRYNNPDGTPGPSPPVGSAIVYVPGTIDRTRLFYDTFRDLGTVCVPYRPVAA